VKISLRVAAILIGTTLLALAQEPVRMAVDRVTIDVYVDASGKPITDLTHDDFTI
jgi:hypothetical protein